jgi:hypothetical protein
LRHQFRAGRDDRYNCFGRASGDSRNRAPWDKAKAASARHPDDVSKIVMHGENKEDKLAA